MGGEHRRQHPSPAAVPKCTPPWLAVRVRRQALCEWRGYSLAVAWRLLRCRRYVGVVARINGLRQVMARLSDEQLAAKTGELRQRLQDWERSLDGGGDGGGGGGSALRWPLSRRQRRQPPLLGGMPEDVVVEGFAVVREAAHRVLGMRHYDVQLVSGIRELHGSRRCGRVWVCGAATPAWDGAVWAATRTARQAGCLAPQRLPRPPARLPAPAGEDAPLPPTLRALLSADVLPTPRPPASPPGPAPLPFQIGGLALHEGQVAEMKTGEGKTLVATLPAYINALTGGVGSAVAGWGGESGGWLRRPTGGPPGHHPVPCHHAERTVGRRAVWRAAGCVGVAAGYWKAWRAGAV